MLLTLININAYVYMILEIKLLKGEV